MILVLWLAPFFFWSFVLGWSLLGILNGTNVGYFGPVLPVVAILFQWFVRPQRMRRR